MIRALEGERGAVYPIIEDMQALPDAAETGACNIAWLYALVEDKSDAFEWLERAIEHRNPRTSWIRTMPAVDSLRSDSRYGPLLRKMNLAEMLRTS